MGTVEVLQGFFKCGASAALVVDSDGRVLCEAHSDGDRVDRLQEAVSKVMVLVDKAFAGFNIGNLERQQVHFGSYQLHVESLNGERHLILVLGTKANLGRIRLEIRKTKKVLEEEIDAK